MSGLALGTQRGVAAKRACDSCVSPDKRRFERVQSLYLLKIRQVETVEHLAVLSGRGRRTISRWLSQYRSGGLTKMLTDGESFLFFRDSFECLIVVLIPLPDTRSATVIPLFYAFPPALPDALPFPLALF